MGEFLPCGHLFGYIVCSDEGTWCALCRVADLERECAENAELQAELDRANALLREWYETWGECWTCRARKYLEERWSAEPASILRRSVGERCADCGCELSECGPQLPDGLRQMDCLPCRLKARIAELERKVEAYEQCIDAGPDELCGEVTCPVCAMRSALARADALLRERTGGRPWQWLCGRCGECWLCRTRKHLAGEVERG